jgi:molybdopterin converting factor subunit 1
MTLRVLLFASYADVLGAPAIDVDLPAGATVRELVAVVRQRAGADRLPPTPLVAVNQSYASLDTPITAHDEVAIIPPVAGG